MSVFTKFAEAKVASKKVSAEDVELAKAMFSELTEEEQAVEKPALESVEAEAVKTVEAEAAEKADADKKALEEAEKAKEEAPKAEEPAVEPVVESAELSEANTKLSEVQKELSELKAEKAARVLSENVAKFTLSEKNSRGFGRTSVTLLSEFVADLDDAQLAKFSELMGKYVTVNTKVAGSGIDGAALDDAKIKVGESTFSVSGADVDMEIKALSESKKISYFEAAKEYAEAKKS